MIRGTKQLVVLLGCAVVLSGLAGCQNPAGVNSSKKAVEVIIEDGGEFPKSLAGTWKADKAGWEITFEPGGNISSIVHNFGKRKLKPGEVNNRPTRFGGKSVYDPGLWTVQYSPDSNELMVEIIIKNFLIEMKGGTLKGNLKDVLIGTVSEEQWQAEWFNFPEYTAFIPEPQKLPVDFNNNPKDFLIFEKMIDTE